MIAWVDIETTGLDVNHDTILEFVLVMTDDDLVSDASFGPYVVRPGILSPPFHTWPPAVQAMHVRSGLVKECELPDAIDIKVLDLQLSAWLFTNYQSQAGQIPLGGSTIGFDWSFMKKYMPRSEDFFHYRSIDISSVKELCRRWQPDVFDRRPKVSDEEKAHRALDDIMGTLEEAIYYKSRIFEREQNW